MTIFPTSPQIVNFLHKFKYAENLNASGHVWCFLNRSVYKYSSHITDKCSIGNIDLKTFTGESKIIYILNELPNTKASFALRKRIHLGPWKI